MVDSAQTADLRSAQGLKGKLPEAIKSGKSAVASGKSFLDAAMEHLGLTTKATA